MASNINRVVLTGNLTRDVELRQTSGGTAVASLRLAVNTRRKDSFGEWVDKPNYFDVTVWGAQGENCARYLSKGRAVAIDGRLDWREWESDGGKRQAVQIVAESVQFLSSPDDAPRRQHPENGGGQPPAHVPPAGGRSDYGVPAGGDFGVPTSRPAAAAAPADEDIPFAPSVI